MTTLPDPLRADEALFLDFDGTLVEIAPHPDAVVVARGLTDALQRLQARQQGALALVSGRPLDELDRWLAPLRLPAAGEHGAQRRGGDGRLTRAAPPDLTAAETLLAPLVAEHPALLVERKQGGLALHYRAAPALEAACVATMVAAVRASTGVELLRGKCVLELKAAGVDKGVAIERFLAERPFSGRRPVFIGDDVTDEAGFLVAERLGGRGVKVGPGPTAASGRLADPGAVRHWLQSSVD